MSFFNKKYRKVKVENIIELLDEFKQESKTLSALKDSTAVTSFTKNADGTIRYLSVSGDDIKLDETIVLDKELEYTTRDGVKTKTIFSLDGDILTNKLSFPDGRVVTFVRDFTGSGLKMTITIEGSEKPPGIVYYESV